jgi:hypothetical protein
MEFHKSNPPMDYQLSQLNSFEMDLYNKNYILDKMDCWSLNDELKTKVYDGDKLYCIIEHYYTLEFSVEYGNKIDWYLNNEKTNTYKNLLEDCIPF